VVRAMAEASLGGTGGGRPPSAAGAFGSAGFEGRLVAIGGLTLLGVAGETDRPCSLSNLTGPGPSTVKGVELVEKALWRRGFVVPPGE
jgi:hypothetical protein